MFHTLKTLSFECLVTIFPFRSSHSIKSGYSSTNWLNTATPFICSLQLFYKSSSLILRHFIKLDEKRYLIETRSREEFWWFKNKDLMVSDPLWFRIIVLSVSKEKRFKTIKTYIGYMTSKFQEDLPPKLNCLTEEVLWFLNSPCLTHLYASTMLLSEI